MNLKTIKSADKYVLNKRDVSGCIKYNSIGVIEKGILIIYI